ncbi:radical SAM protein [Verrucomicrobiota bacterium]
MNNPVFRPPSEADSLILQIDQGCPYNRCTFCAMYKDIAYKRRNIEEIRFILENEVGSSEHVKRIFLADGDAMKRPYEELCLILELIIQKIPGLTRINSYATGSSILDKTEKELQTLRSLKLHTLYIGLESGDEETLRNVKKRETAEEMVQAVCLAQSAGLRVSVIVLLGLAGSKRSHDHAINTAKVLNQMQPRLLSFLRLVPVTGTELKRQIDAGEMDQLSEYSVIEEMRNIAENLELKKTVFRADHSSNIVPLEARLPRDKTDLLHHLNSMLNSGNLDKTSPGTLPLWL